MRPWPYSRRGSRLRVCQGNEGRELKKEEGREAQREEGGRGLIGP